MKRLNSHLLSHLLGGVVGIACGFGLAWALSPERHIPPSSFIVLTGSWCPKSQHLEQQIREDPELARRVMTLDITNDGSRDCGPLADTVLSEAPWLRAFDRAWICQRLIRHAALVHEDDFTALPAWLHGGVPIPASEEYTTLARSHLTLCPGPTLHVGDIPCPSEPRVTAPEETQVEAAEHGQDIGF